MNLCDLRQKRERERQTDRETEIERERVCVCVCYGVFVWLRETERVCVRVMCEREF